MVPPIVQQKVVVGSKDPVGLHLRPAQLFVQLANRFPCEIEVVRDTLRVDGKSILHMMTLAAEPGTELVIEAGGPDAQAAVEALARFVENDFVIDETMSPSPAK
jgi:phosphocarrier protein HPr